MKPTLNAIIGDYNTTESSATHYLRYAIANTAEFTLGLLEDLHQSKKVALEALRTTPSSLTEELNETAQKHGRTFLANTIKIQLKRTLNTVHMEFKDEDLDFLLDKVYKSAAAIENKNQAAFKNQAAITLLENSDAFGND